MCEIKEQIEKDYGLVMNDEFNITKSALQELLVKIKSISDSNVIYSIIENLISQKANFILKNISKKKISKIEKDIFIMNMYNTYLSRFKFGKKRQIILNHAELQFYIQNDFRSNIIHQERSKNILK